MTVVDDNGSGIIAVTVSAVTTPTPAVVGIGPAKAVAIIRRPPAPITTIVGIIPAAAPTEAPATHAPTEAESTAIAIAVAVPWAEPRIVIAHARRIVIEAVYAIGIFAIAVFISIIIVVIPVIGIVVFVIPTVGILPFLRPFVVVIIRALVICFPCLGIIIIDIIAESHLPRGATCTEYDQAY